MNLSKCLENDVTDIMKIVKSAQNQLKLLNVDQWQDGYPNLEIIQNDIKMGHAYKVVDKDNIVAYMVISFECEIDYNHIDGKWTKNLDYAVIHRLCINEAYRHQHLSNTLFKLAFKYIKAHNYNYLRIDTHPDNFIMRHILNTLHFNECGIIRLTRGGAIRIAYDIILNN